MRKYVRSIIKTKGVYDRLKPSRYVKAVFDRIQQRKYGVEKRRNNQAKGTHKKYLWISRTANIGAR